MKTILHATDFSEGADAARREAMRIAIRFGAGLLLVHVVEDIALAADLPLVELDRIYETQVAWAEQELAARAAEAGSAGVTARTAVLRGIPASAIARAAEEAQADLIVVGTHGRGGVRRLLLGSVAERVVRTAPCPVLTVRESSNSRQAA